ncbi:MAG: hypothetical protein HKN60_05710 [Rhizobiales bacterium]|nr:hypothetical protein [Hyphomicrobiales bacterium]
MAETAAGGDQTAPLDDIMLAMDVVDTLRHREHVIDRELSEDEREEGLVERLKEIYAAQGIEVPERILKEGVEGLKQARFTYEAPAAGLQTMLARVYVSRWRWGRIAGIAVLALAVLWGGYTFGYRLPAERAAEAARVELAQAIPDKLKSLAGEIDQITTDATAKSRAVTARDQGLAAAANGERTGADAALARLETLRDLLTSEYAIRIVQDQGEQSGIWRVPDVNDTARNYYLIVEAIGADGGKVTVSVESEETGKPANVTRWGQRVSESAFDRVVRDKRDDGIIQADVIGAKQRGALDPEFSFPVENGAITEW